MGQTIYRRKSEDGACEAWVGQRSARPDQYVVQSYSPWHNTGSGTIYPSEAEARAVVDGLIEEWYPAARRQPTTPEEWPPPCPSCGAPASQVFADEDGQDHYTRCANGHPYSFK